MNEIFIRTAMIIGEENVEKLNKSHVAVFGIGGVGSFVAEALARAGVGSIDIFDHDTVSKSNINRQLIALHSTVGKKKTSVMAERIKDINPDCQVKEWDIFYGKDNADDVDLSIYSYVIDAVDTVSAKLELIERCTNYSVPIISSMGTGNKVDPSKFQIADIYKTKVCPLAKVMRYELKKRGIKKLKVLYSEELPIEPENIDNSQMKGRSIAPGSISFVPSVAGLMIAGEVIRDITGVKPKK